MSSIEIGIAGIVLLLAMLVIRIPVGVAMLTVGIGGYWVITGWLPISNLMKQAAYYRFATYDLAVVPMFLLMSQFAAKAGLSRALFSAANAFLGHFRGGVAMAGIAGCAGFGAICGSSLATAATMGQVALPELRRYNYSGALATGTLAAGGTLGILIPPSVVLVIYAITVEVNIAKLFLAAFIPGILAAIGYLLAIAIYVRVYPEAGPAGPRATRAERLRALGETWPVLLIFLVVIGGIYAGVFTPTEGAAVGAFGTGVIAYWRGGMRLDGFLDSVTAAAIASALIFLILLGAAFFNNFLALSRLPNEVADFIQELGVSPISVLVVMLLIYLVLGCLMDSLSMILLTIPIFWPILEVLDFGMTETEVKLWFGIIALIVVEVGLITPPVGLNVFIINSMAKDVPMRDTFAGMLPFLASDFVRTAILVMAPAITLYLPRVFG